MALVQPSKEEIQDICRKLGTDLGKLNEDVLAIKDWLKGRNDLSLEADESTLKAFIIGSKSNLKRAKEKLENLEKARGKFPAIFDNLDPFLKEFQETAIAKPYLILPRLTEEGCRVHLSTTGPQDPSGHSIECYIQRVVATLQIAYLRQPFSSSDYFLFDCRNFTLGHALKVTPHHINLMLHCAQDVLPVVVKAVIFINASSSAEFVVNKLVKPFLKKKIADRVFVYKEDHTAVYRHFKKEILPKDYGGNEDSVETLNREWMNVLMEERALLLKRIRGRSIELPKAPKNLTHQITEPIKFNNLSFD